LEAYCVFKQELRRGYLEKRYNFGVKKKTVPDELDGYRFEIISQDLVYKVSDMLLRYQEEIKTLLQR